MFKVISQIVLLIIFLFLTIFVTVWFNDTEGKEDSVDSRQSISWLSESVKITGSVINAFLPSTEKDDNNQVGNNNSSRDLSTDNTNFIDNTPEIYDGLSDAAKNYISSDGVKENEFRNFVGDIIEKSPKYYLDVKLYNSTWEKFWSFYWLKYREEASE